MRYKLGNTHFFSITVAETSKISSFRYFHDFRQISFNFLIFDVKICRLEEFISKYHNADQKKSWLLKKQLRNNK